MMKDKLQVIKNLLDFINSSPASYQASMNICSYLEDGGFEKLDEGSPWELKPGRGYYVERNGSSVAAFRLGLENIADKGFMIAGAHTDSPGLKIKPAGISRKGNLERFSVEVYGSPLVSTWLDRELGAAGVVNVKVDGRWRRKPFMSSGPVAVIPNAAVHLNRDFNKGFEYNRQEHLQAIIPGNNLADEMSDYFNTDHDSIGDFDLFLYDVHSGSIISDELIVSPRIDNLAMCHAIYSALIDSSVSKSTPVAVFYDNEEIGSRTYQGADASFLSDVLERIILAARGTKEDFFRAKSASFMISADGAHAVHPNFPDKHDPGYSPALNGGVVLKMNAGYSYATNSYGAGIFSGLCDEAGTALQRFIGRSDIPSGGTIGAVSSAVLGIQTVDVGTPMLAMHSIRETAGISDHSDMIKILKYFFSNGIEYVV